MQNSSDRRRSPPSLRTTPIPGCLYDAQGWVLPPIYQTVQYFSVGERLLFGRLRSSAVKIGEPTRERTIKYFPEDGDFEAKEETDMYLLAMTLLEMYDTIPRASERKDSLTKSEFHDAKGGCSGFLVVSISLVLRYPTLVQRAES
jgi:hypothetical protein